MIITLGVFYKQKLIAFIKKRISWPWITTKNARIN